MKNTGETLIDAHLETAVDREYRRVQFLKRRDVLLSILTPLLLLAAWEIAARSGAIDARLFTPPSAIGARAWDMIASGSLWEHVLGTLGRLLAGLAAGAGARIIIGLLMGVWRTLRPALGTTRISLC